MSTPIEEDLRGDLKHHLRPESVGSLCPSEGMPTLRSNMIRLAHTNESLRPHLLPILAAAEKEAHRLDGVRRHKLMPADIKAKIPPINGQESADDPIVWVKYFSPYTNALWLVTEFDGSDEMFGWADLGMGGGELGYISLSELEGLERRGLPLVERDTSWRPMPLSKAKGLNMDSTLRSNLIRLASANPDLRPHLLPLLMERVAAIMPADPALYNATLPDFAEYKSKMQAVLQEAIQAFPPQSVLGQSAKQDWHSLDVVKNDNPTLGLAFQIGVPKYGKNAHIFIYTTVRTAAGPNAWGRKDKDVSWTVEMAPWAIDDSRHWKVLAGFLKAKKPFFVARNPATAMSNLDGVKTALIAAAKAIPT